MKWTTPEPYSCQHILEMLQNRGVNLADSGIDVSNPNLNITDLRVTRNTGIGMEWEARINSRIGASASVGESRFQDLRSRSFQAGNSTNPAAEDNRIRDLNMRRVSPLPQGTETL